MTTPTESLASANANVLELLALTRTWLEHNAVRGGSKWHIGTSWYAETHYTYLEGMLEIWCPNTDERFKLVTRGRDANDFQAWMDALEYARG